MCIRDRSEPSTNLLLLDASAIILCAGKMKNGATRPVTELAVSYTHLRAHETVLDLVCRLLLEQKNIYRLHDLIHEQTQLHAHDGKRTNHTKALIHIKGI